MDLAEFDYHLPAEAVAQEAVEPRDAARLLVDRGPGAAPTDATVAQLDTLVGPGDVVVVNTTRVRPARLRLRRPTGGAAEVLVLAPHPSGGWEALVRPSGRIRPGELLTPSGTEHATALQVEVGEDLGEGRRVVRLLAAGGDLGPDEVEAALERHGVMPLPPYLDDRPRDPARYQTVMARRPGSAAAPTAGLHLTPALLDRIRQAGASLAEVELQVGLGTFRPMTSDVVEDHVMHAERYRIDPAQWANIRSARSVLAVGTTTVRALESAARSERLEGETELFLHRGATFQVVDRMMTNFHLPRSSLLVMVDAFIGARWRALYETALQRGYRFLSFGDAMLLDSGLLDSGLLEGTAPHGGATP
ncbi:MAG: tRNA preQ1(34) S-adenosylmethionine ribosyltransferase-isomerase QueA [Microthrixaceae bacterium]